MKKITSMLLSLALIVGTASLVVLAQDRTTKYKPEPKVRKKKLDPQSKGNKGKSNNSKGKSDKKTDKSQ